MLLATQTVCPVAGLDEHELVTLGVATRLPGPSAPSIFVTAIPVEPQLQQPFGTYAVTFPGLVGTSTPRELVGMHADNVGLVWVTLTFEQLLLLKTGPDVSLMLTL